MNPSSSLVPFSSGKRKRGPSSYNEHYSCKRPKNDVFVNYSIEDTGNCFVSHLKTALKRNIFTISDRTTLPIGQDESSELLKAIEDSQIFVVVFSTKYPISVKSLDELVLIMDSLSKFKNRKVVPVFLNVEPSDVRNLQGCFEEAFRTHEANVDPERVHEWKQALKAAGERSGLPLKNGDEADSVQKIVQELKKIKTPEELLDADHPVGIEPRAQAIISKLRLYDQEFSDIVAVLGISGSGKTTVVKAVYDRIVADFNYSCFIENIHYRNKGPNWKLKLQREVLDRLTGNDPSYNVTAQQIKKFMNNNKVLLVLDDVEKPEELRELGIPSSSDSGSRTIVTTRNKQCFVNLPHTLYEISLLNNEEAFELFVGYAYGEGDRIDENFVKGIVYHAGGLPLVLEVWGLHFKAHDRKLWPNLLKTLKRIPHEDIQMKLRMSYDSLCERSKSLFLDIACFFDGMWTSDIFKVLEDQTSSFFPEIEIQVLLDRGLVRIEDKEVVLHEVIRQMGQEVVRRENEDEPGQRTRLMDHRDVLHVFENNSGTNFVRSIMMDAEDHEEQCIQVDAFKRMNNLRFIQLVNEDHDELKYKRDYSFSNDDTSLSFKHLKYLEWDSFPQRRIDNIDMSNVVVIILRYSNLEILWEGFKNLKKLRILDVSFSELLTRTGSFIGLENLEELDLSYCYNLKEVDSSIVCLEKLRKMSFQYCKNIKSIPNLPPNIEEICGRNCKSLVCLPSNMHELQCLTELHLDNCVTLGSENLMKLTGIRNLQVLDMDNCNVSQVSVEIGNLVSLEKLFLSGNPFSTLPDSFSNLSQLVHLEIRDCSRLQYLPFLPSNLESIKAYGCSSLDLMPFDSLQAANIFCSKMFKESLFTRTLCIELSGNESLDWCSTAYKERGNVLTFVAPVHMDKKICGAILLLSGVTSSYHKLELHSRILNKTKETGHHIDISAMRKSSEILIFCPLNDTTLVVEAGDTVELQFEKYKVGISSCVLTFIYEGDVIDSALVIQNRNLTHEHTFCVPSEMNAAASITQLTDHVSSFSIQKNTEDADYYRWQYWSDIGWI